MHFRELSADSRRLYAVLFLNFTLYGVTLTIAGAAVPKIVRSFGWSYTVTGAVLAAGAAGYFSSTFFTGLTVHILGPRLNMLIGLALEGAALFFFARSPQPFLNAALYFLLGVAQGITEVVTNLEVIKLEKEGESWLMSLLHASFCLGAVVGPFAVGSLMGSGLGWNSIFRGAGIAAFLMIAPMALVRFFTLPEDGEREKKRGMSLLTEPLILFFFFIILFYVGSELGVSNWISEYFVKDLGVTPGAGAFAVSVLWLGILIGRLMISMLYRGRRQERLLLMLACCCSIFLFLVIAVTAPVVTAVFLFLSGLGYSGIYPLVMTLVGKSSREGFAVGFVSTGGGVGAFAFPFFLAYIADRAGLRGSFLLCAFLNLLLVMFAVLAALKLKRG